MQQRLPPLRDPPIAFAHRGARSHAPENTVEAFELALRLGASGLETDVWLTSDGVPVLDHDGVVRRGALRKRTIRETPLADLPEHIPTLEALLGELGTAYELSIDVKDPDAARSVWEIATAAGIAERTWLCHPDLDRVIRWRAELDRVRLVHSTRLERLGSSPEQHAARLSREGIDAMNMHRADWNGGLVVMFHRFDVLAFGWDLQLSHQMENGLLMGLDAVYSDDVEMMHTVFATVHGP